MRHFYIYVANAEKMLGTESYNEIFVIVDSAQNYD